MDKITRMLLLYSRLIKGERIDKMTFCLENDCISRSFDRDIEDVRLFLSETFDTRELLYDRREKVYYLSGSFGAKLELVEYLLIERILMDTGVLRQDEMVGLLKHLLSNTEHRIGYFDYQKNSLHKYQEANHQKALLKMHGDLVTIIQKQCVIEINYVFAEGVEENILVIPCCLKYMDGYLFLTSFLLEDKDVRLVKFRLEKIHSFRQVRMQVEEERSHVKKYLDDMTSFTEIEEYKPR